MNCGSNQKQELQARLYGYNKLIGLQGLINAFEHNCTNLYETAEFLEDNGRISYRSDSTVSN